jgi:cytochrome b
MMLDILMRELGRMTREQSTWTGVALLAIIMLLLKVVWGVSGDEVAREVAGFAAALGGLAGLAKIILPDRAAPPPQNEKPPTAG